MSEVKPLNIVKEDGTIFSQERYFIPLYQRAFAWETDEIHRLITDIYDYKAEAYYLGSLIVSERKDGMYEVIDGQQRLTALFLLLHYLGYNLDNDRLVYECRTKSNYTLNHLGDLDGTNLATQLDADKIEDTLKKGLEDIDKKFINSRVNDEIIDREKFKEKLKKVLLFRIEVPPHTDLNRYFEIMNVRGEQLEQHDIVKAKLMDAFRKDSGKRSVFAKIWDACRDMTGYVQMHFYTNNNDRENLFGDKWEELNLENIDQIKDSGNIQESTALDIIKQDNIEPPTDGENEDGKQVRFDSIIDFPYFLLHVLKVFTGEDVSFDDKTLAETFEKQIKKCTDAEQFSLGFIKCLLKCRFLFDKFIIKREREYKSNDKNGKWSLKALHNYNGKAQYTFTEFKNKGERNTTYEKAKQKRHNNILMLQACLRVSDTSPKSMPWITLALKWLHDNYHFYKSANLEFEIENYIKDRIKEDYKLLEEKGFALGVSTPHLVLNYLDYLLWQDRGNAQYRELHFDDFDFEFRNSVEHWYPQHPSGFDSWEQRDRFGNLCLLSREVNSKFSNANPVAKQGYNKIIEKGSLKLRLMCKSTTTDDAWKQENGDCAEHEKKMLGLLQNACNLPVIP